jgi:hypothetical protein
MLRLRRIWEGQKKLSDYIRELDPKKVALCSGHGLGDQIMIIEPIRKLCQTFPDIEFTLVLQDGLGFQELAQDLPCKSIYVNDMSYNRTDVNYGYDIIADVDFCMNEGQQVWTKGQWACIHELGIEPNEVIYPKLTSGKNRLILCQFFITCLPDSCNADYDTAKQIWNDILEAGYIPMEMYFTHVFSNPVNAKYDFIDSTTRKCQPKISSLVGLIESAAGVISVVTGNLHVCLANKEPERIFFLEKDFKLESFIKNNTIARANVREYKGEVKEWLKKLDYLEN